MKSGGAGAVAVAEVVSGSRFFRATDVAEQPFDGEDIENLTIFYKGKTQSYYSLFSYYASDESEDDFIEIRKVTSSGEFISCSYFRGIYYKIK